MSQSQFDNQGIKSTMAQSQFNKVYIYYGPVPA